MISCKWTYISLAGGLLKWTSSLLHTCINEVLSRMEATCWGWSMGTCDLKTHWEQWNCPTNLKLPLSRILLEKAMATHSSTLAWKIPWWRSLVGCSPWGREESDTTEWLHFNFSLSCFGEGNGKPLQCSCLENSRDRRAWWAAIHGVTQSRTWLKRLSSSSRKIC